MVEGRIKSSRKVGNNGYRSKSCEIYETILVYKKAQKSILLNKAVRNGCRGQMHCREAQWWPTLVDHTCQWEMLQNYAPCLGGGSGV